MASRQEEKEKRRLERLRQEEADRKAAARRKRLQMVAGGVLALALVAAIAVGIASGLGGDDETERADGGRTATAENVDLPEPQETDFEAAAKAAGCTLEHPALEGAGHEDREFTADDYQTNPPTSGPHNPDWYEDGVYAPGNVPQLGMLVHALEHGRINVQYAPGTPQETVDQLEAFLAEKTNYHMLLYENTTDMPYEVAATAWGHQLGCEEMNPRVFDALRTFYDRYVDKGPEQVP